MLKFCSVCKQEKSIDAFSKTKEKIRSSCKDCNKQYYLNNRNKILNKKKYYTQKTKKIRSEYNKKYRQKNKEYLNKKSNDYYAKNKEQISKKAKIYREKNKEKLSANKKIKYIKNKEYLAQQNKKYREQNKETLNKKKNEYIKHKHKTNIQFKLTRILRGRLNKALRQKYKSGSAVSDLGCSIDHLKLHLELFWDEGMSWDNYGKNGWVIDHIIPLSSFDLTDRDQFLKAVHYTNLQPLWEKDNLIKSDYIQ